MIVWADSDEAECEKEKAIWIGGCHRHQTMVASHSYGWTIRNDKTPCRQVWDNNGGNIAYLTACISLRYSAYQPLEWLATNIPSLCDDYLNSKVWKRNINTTYTLLYYSHREHLVEVKDWSHRTVSSFVSDEQDYCTSVLIGLRQRVGKSL